MVHHGSGDEGTEGPNRQGGSPTRTGCVNLAPSARIGGVKQRRFHHARRFIGTAQDVNQGEALRLLRKILTDCFLLEGGKIYLKTSSAKAHTVVHRVASIKLINQAARLMGVVR